ncbi:MAG TPA: transglycosylase SLT domain-containing protein [Gemmatimonadales bacterium]|nr:transglycosylase SLT domain-containing protein [Gemmatimonadales bacterium]
MADRRAWLRLLAALALAGCTTEPGGAQSADPALAAARSALESGLPWRSTRMLAPILADSTTRTPAAVLLAAEAAAAWEGWGEVERLLSGAAWLDSLSGGRGHALLAEAALAHRADTAAQARAARAVALVDSADLHERGRRLVLLARAEDRLSRFAEAAAAYSAAAGLLPDIADWLRLRAMAVSPDSAARAQLDAELTLPLARERAARSDAQALERARNWSGAAGAWTRAGERQRALAAALAAAPDRAESTAVRGRLVDLVRERPGRADAERAVGVLDLAFGRLAAAEELVVFRSAVRSGPRPRADQAFKRAAEAGLVVPNDRLLHAGMLERLGRYAEAAEMYARVRPPSALAPQAAYLRARALLRSGRLEPARAALRRVLSTSPRDTAAAISLILLADLAIDEGRDADARTAYLRAGREFPGTRFGALGRYQAAVIAFALGHRDTAAAEFDSVTLKHPSSPEALGALYWAGRSWAAVGDSARARDRWEQVRRADPSSYYGALATARLGAASWSPIADSALPAPSPDLEAALDRAEALQALGLLPEAQAEYDRLLADADQSLERQLATAAGFLRHAKPWRAIELGWRAIGRGAPRTTATLRLVYPLMLGEGIRALARDHGLDPALVAGLIRQESTFNPSATSAAGARGLMQVMPDVGARTARGLGYPVWAPELLWQPDVNLEVGTVHLAEMTSRFPETVRVLAAYNAGSTRVARWDERTGAEDPELYAERIPFRETRDYVRVVQRNREIYRALYPELSPPPSP